MAGEVSSMVVAVVDGTGVAGMTAGGDVLGTVPNTESVGVF